MAVYTPVSDLEVTEFLQNYEIGDLISLTEITEGVENSNFLLRTSIDSYILTLYEKRVNAEDLPFFMKLLSELSLNEISCPRPIPDKTKRVCPNGWVCQAVRAFGSNDTLIALTLDGSGATIIGSWNTTPWK